MLVIIAIMLVCILAFFNPIFLKTGTAVTITSNDSVYAGDAFSITLADENGNPLADQLVEVKFTDSDEQTITTDGMGNGMLELNGLEPGQYDVSVEYKGNGNYSSSSASQALTVSEATTTSASQSQSSDSPQTVTLELNSYDEYVSTAVGDYKVEAMKLE